MFSTPDVLKRACGLAVALGALAGTACAGTAVELPPGPFKLVESQDVYLNGLENEDRPPISFMLVGATASPATMSETELVDVYVDALHREGWGLDRYDTDEDWWTFYGARTRGSIRVGPASRFVELATADEGYVRPKFRRAVSALDEPLIVMSVDPYD